MSHESSPTPTTHSAGKSNKRRNLIRIVLFGLVTLGIATIFPVMASSDRMVVAQEAGCAPDGSVRLCVFAPDDPAIQRDENLDVPSDLTEEQGRLLPQTGPFAPSLETTAAVEDGNLARDLTALPGGGGPSPQVFDPAPGFDGLDATDNNFWLAPPDVQIAVGPNHVVEFVNVAGRVSSKGGTEISTYDLEDFFDMANDTVRLADPKIIYDDESDRFFATIFSMTNTVGRVHLAVSVDSDGTGTCQNGEWRCWTYDETDINDLNGNFPDYPAIGLTSDKVTLTWNLFNIDTRDFEGSQILVLNKQDSVSGDPLSGAITDPDNSEFTLRPVHSLTPINDQFTYHVERPFLSFNYTDLVQHRITGVPGVNTVNITEQTMSIDDNNAPPPAEQSGSGILLDTGDHRLLEATLRGNLATITATTDCNFTGDTDERACIHLIQVQHGTSPTVVTDETVGFSGSYLFYPAHRTDSSGRVHINFSRSDSGRFGSAWVTGFSSGTWESAFQIKAGELAVTFGNDPTTRWGDYLGAAVDPSNQSCVWHAGEYAKSAGLSDWGTWVAPTQFDSDASDCLVPDQPDLIVSAVTPENTSPPFEVGQSVRFEGVIENVGTGTADQSDVGYYIGTTCGDTSTQFGTDGVPSLIPGAGVIEGDNRVFEQGDIGTRWVSMVADWNGQVAESNESNNVACYGPFEVVGKPDLTLDGVVPDGGLEPPFQVGQEVVFETVVRNSGSAAAPASVVGYYLDSTCNARTKRFGTDNVGPLTPNDFSIEGDPITFEPSDVGSRIVTVVADWSFLVDESDESNNVSCYGPFEVTEVPAPDLIVSVVTPEIASPPFEVGQSVRFEGVIENIGTGTAAQSDVAYYLGTSCGDTSIQFGIDGVPSLIPGAGVIEGDNRVFEQRDIGTRWVSMVADWDNQVAESNESNNVACYGPFEVEAAPELIVVNDPIPQGGEIQFEFTGFRPDSPVNVFVVGGGGITVQSDQNGSGSGSFHLLSEQPGPYTLRAEDGFGNAAEAPFTVVPAQLPDLVITDPSFVGESPPFTVGQTVNLGATLMNIGPGSSGPSVTGLFVETSCTPDSPPEVNVPAPGLTPSGSVPLSVTLQFTSADIGTRFLVARADHDGSVEEENENNNDACLGPFEVVGLSATSLVFEMDEVSVSTGGTQTVMLEATDLPPGTDTVQAQVRYNRAAFQVSNLVCKGLLDGAFALGPSDVGDDTLLGCSLVGGSAGGDGPVLSFDLSRIGPNATEPEMIHLIDEGGPFATAYFEGGSQFSFSPQPGLPTGVVDKLNVTSGVTVSGTISLQGVTLPNSICGDIEVYLVDPLNTDHSLDSALAIATVGSDGTFEFSGVGPGTYDVIANAPRHVFARFVGLVVTDGDVVLPDVELRGGDVSGDEAVAGGDISVVVGSFGASDSELPGDANCDGFVSGADISLVVGNFGLVGPTSWP